MRELKFNPSEETIDEVVYTRKVFYYETDKMAVVHHSNYIRWFEEARIYFMDIVGIPHLKFEEAGLMIPVVSVNAHYKTPTRFGETVAIHVWISFFNGIRLKCAYCVENAENGEILCTGESEHCFVDQTFKPVSLRKSYPEFYQVFKAHVKEGKD